MKHILFFLTFFIFLTINSYAHSPEGAQALIDHYAPLRDALVQDDLETAQKKAIALSKYAKEKDEHLVLLCHEISHSKSLDEARETFKEVSDYVIKHVSNKEGYFIGECPMAKAKWVQTDEKVKNPYMGKSMLSCGSVQKTTLK